MQLKETYYLLALILGVVQFTSGEPNYLLPGDRVNCFGKINRRGVCRHPRLGDANSPVTFLECCRQTSNRLNGKAYTITDNHRECHTCPAARNGRWSPWSPWSLCSTTCGNQGTRHRQRLCSSPTPLLDGKQCRTASNKRQLLEEAVETCQQAPCPVDGSWSEWSAYSECSVPCGRGSEISHRACNNPPPSNGGRPCFGRSERVRSCVEAPCRLPEPDANWHPWGQFTACSKPCGLGTKTRSRTCRYSQDHGVVCIGAKEETHYCHLKACSGTHLPKTRPITCGGTSVEGSSGSGSGSGSGAGHSSSEGAPILSDDEDDIDYSKCCRRYGLVLSGGGRCCKASAAGEHNSGGDDDGSADRSGGSASGSGSGSGTGSSDDEDTVRSLHHQRQSCRRISNFQEMPAGSQDQVRGRKRRETVDHIQVDVHHLREEDHLDEDYSDDDLVLMKLEE